MTQVYINDANILIDLCNLDIVDEFLLLPFRLCTTDFVIAELEVEQQACLVDKLEIIESNSDDFLEIIGLMDKGKGLSFEDCSVWYFAEKRNGILMTSDGKLRKTATIHGTVVKGLLHFFEEMKNHGCMTLEKCIAKLEELKEINPRAPKNHIDILIERLQK